MFIFDDGTQERDLESFGFGTNTDFSYPFMSEYQEKTMFMPGSDITLDFGENMKPLIFSIDTLNLFHDEMEFNIALDELVAFFLDRFRKPKIIKVTYKGDPNKFIYAKIMKSSVPNRSNFVKDFTLSFVANDPTKYALSDVYDPDRIIRYGEVQPGDYYKNTQSFNWIYRRHYSGIHNYSPFTTPLRVTIKGTVTKGSVTHLESGIKLTFPNVKNGTLILDGENQIVSINGNDTLVGSNYEFFELIEKDNGFLFEGNMPNAHVTFDWLHRF